MATPSAPPALALRARLLIGGQWVDGVETFAVTDKFTGEVIGHADRASRAQVDAAVAAAEQSFAATTLDATARYTLLRTACDLIETRRAELVRILTAEDRVPDHRHRQRGDARHPDAAHRRRRRQASGR